LNRAVPDTGPWTARLLIVGEAGGKEEGRQGEPFVGPTGNELKRRVEKAGLNWGTDVRRANVIPYEMPGLPKTVGGMKEVVRQNWDSLNNTLVNGDYKAVLTVGRAALYRLTGKTGIKAETGGVFCPVPASVIVGSEFKATRVRDVPVVACLHPAAVMRTKLGAEWALVNVAVKRACGYALGDPFVPMAQWPDVFHYGEWNAEALSERLDETSAVAIDTEFNVATGLPFLVGIEEIGESYGVMSIRPGPKVN
jgi:uracil-DNA glycosylase family 4